MAQRGKSARIAAAATEAAAASPLSSKRVKVSDQENRGNGAIAPTDEKEAGKAQSNEVSPYRRWCEKKDMVMAAQNAKKALLTRGLVKGGNPDHSDSEEDDDDENEDVDAYTQAEVDTIGLVIMPEKRVKALEAMEKLVVGDQYGDSFMMFNTSFSYEVIHAFGQFKKRLQKGKTWADKFDLLFGFTMAIDKYDVWMNDHEMGWRQEGGDAMLRFLASKWKAALKQGDAELGIDSDFTRPGVIAMLEQFKKNLRRPEDYQGDGGMKFNYK